MIHAKINGLIVSEQDIEQWVGNDAEYSADFGYPFTSTPPSFAVLATACRARETRSAPAPAPAIPLTKAQRIKIFFEDNPEMLAMVKTIATLTGQTRLQIVTTLINNLA